MTTRSVLVCRCDVSVESQTFIIKMAEPGGIFQALAALKSRSPEASREHSLSLLSLLAHSMTKSLANFLFTLPSSLAVLKSQGKVDLR